MSRPLPNARHERFAQALAQGKPASRAYVDAGYAANEGNAVRMKGNERVAARVAAIQAQAADAAALSVRGITDDLLRIAAQGRRRRVARLACRSPARPSWTWRS